MARMAATISLGEAGEDLGGVVRSRGSDAVTVIDVIVEIAEDRDGIPSVNLTATLADPEVGADTWPLESVLPLRRAVRARANEMGIEAPVYLWFKPQSDPPQDDDA